MSPAYSHKFHLRNLIRFLLGFGIVLGLLWYLGFQARNLIAGPQITLTNEPSTIEHTRSIELTGNARNIVELTLNGNPIFTDENGVFQKKLVLENGYTIMTLRATDRFGRETTLSRPFVYSAE